MHKKVVMMKGANQTQKPGSLSHHDLTSAKKQPSKDHNKFTTFDVSGKHANGLGSYDKDVKAHKLAPLKPGHFHIDEDTTIIEAFTNGNSGQKRQVHKNFSYLHKPQSDWYPIKPSDKLPYRDPFSGQGEKFHKYPIKIDKYANSHLVKVQHQGYKVHETPDDDPTGPPKYGPLPPRIPIPTLAPLPHPQSVPKYIVNVRYAATSGQLPSLKYANLKPISLYPGSANTQSNLHSPRLPVAPRFPLNGKGNHFDPYSTMHTSTSPFNPPSTSVQYYGKYFSNPSTNSFQPSGIRYGNPSPHTLQTSGFRYGSPSPHTPQTSDLRYGTPPPHTPQTSDFRYGTPPPHTPQTSDFRYGNPPPNTIQTSDFKYGNSLPHTPETSDFRYGNPSPHTLVHTSDFRYGSPSPHTLQTSGFRYGNTGITSLEPTSLRYGNPQPPNSQLNPQPSPIPPPTHYSRSTPIQTSSLSYADPNTNSLQISGLTYSNPLQTTNINYVNHGSAAGALHSADEGYGNTGTSLQSTSLTFTNETPGHVQTSNLFPNHAPAHVVQTSAYGDRIPGSLHSPVLGYSHSSAAQPASSPVMNLPVAESNEVKSVVQYMPCTGGTGDDGKCLVIVNSRNLGGFHYSSMVKHPVASVSEPLAKYRSRKDVDKEKKDNDKREKKEDVKKEKKAEVTTAVVPRSSGTTKKEHKEGVANGTTKKPKA